MEEEPGVLLSMGSQKLDKTEVTEHAARMGLVALQHVKSSWT